MSKRAIRRHHETRIKHQVIDYFGGYARGQARQLGKLEVERARETPAIVIASLCTSVPR